MLLPPRGFGGRGENNKQYHSAKRTATYLMLTVLRVVCTSRNLPPRGRGRARVRARVRVRIGIGY